MGFLEPHRGLNRKRGHQTVQVTKPQFIIVFTASMRFRQSLVAAGASFGKGHREHFHHVIKSDVSLLQGDSTMVVQVQRDTPRDIPIHCCCTHRELGARVSVIMTPGTRTDGERR